MLMSGMSFSEKTTAYINRVTADGGICINPDAIEEAYALLDTLNITSVAIAWVNVQFGIKLQENQKIVKLYDLFNLNDFVQTNATNQPVLQKDSADKYCAYFNNSNYNRLSSPVVTMGVKKASYSITFTPYASNRSEYYLTNINTVGSTTQLALFINPSLVYQSFINEYGAAGNAKSATIPLSKQTASSIIDKSLVATEKIKFYLNDVAQTTSYLSGSPAANFVDCSFTIGGRNDSGFEPGYSKMNFYNLFLVKDATSYATIKSIQDFSLKIN